MRSVALVGCGKSKREGTHPARELYTGNLFVAALAHAERYHQHVFILSALHHLVPLDRELAAYNETLAGKSKRELDGWTDRVRSFLLHDLRPKPSDPIRVSVYAGKAYADNIVRPLIWWSEHTGIADRKGSITVDEPLKGLGIGQRLAWFKDRRVA